MMPSSLRPYLYAGFIALIMSVGFQNCSAPRHLTEELQLASSYDPFAYPYKEKPTFYSEAVLLVKESESQSLSQFRVAINVAYAETNAPVDYEVRTQDDQGRLLCPTRSGTLSPGQSFISFDCVAIYKDVPIKIILNANADGHSEEKEFLF